MYFFMGLMACYAGWQIWLMFLKLDSDRYPMKTYGDIAYRIYGKYTRHGFNLLQSVQLLFNVGVIIIVNGYGLSQVTKSKLCFSVCVVIWPIVGFVLGQIRTLAKFGHVANFAIWLNIAVILMTMGIAAKYGPNFAVALAEYSIPKGPILHTTLVPSGSTFVGQVGAAMQIVYAYGEQPSMSTA
jgi:hypothetical protein